MTDPLSTFCILAEKAKWLCPVYMLSEILLTNGPSDATTVLVWHEQQTMTDTKASGLV